MIPHMLSYSKATQHLRLYLQRWAGKRFIRVRRGPVSEERSACGSTPAAARYCAEEVCNELQQAYEHMHLSNRRPAVHKKHQDSR
mmetsp:Transcript_25479/g.38508  ORF Transcript_25479/g.38508 Transcript_25479/m.38508 type:complete len:85 (+) Transcript_25479:1190-1444(+)